MNISEIKPGAGLPPEMLHRKIANYERWALTIRRVGKLRGLSPRVIEACAEAQLQKAMELKEALK